MSAQTAVLARWIVIPAGLAALVTLVYVGIRHGNTDAPGTGDDRGEPVDLVHVGQIVDGMGMSRRSPDQVLTFLGCIVTPQRYFEKIAERVVSCSEHWDEISAGILKGDPEASEHEPNRRLLAAILKSGKRK